MLRTLITVVLLLLCVPATAQEPGFLELTGNHLRAPVTRSGATLLWLGIGTAVLSEDLENPEREVHFLEWPPLEPVSDIGNAFGDGKFVAAAAVGTWTAGTLLHHGRTAAFGRDLSATFIATGAWVWALKASIGAPRPDGGPHSFPSGHTAVAFATAATVHRHFSGLAGFLGYTAATMTAAARMEDRRHFFRDVGFGATLGMAVAGVRLPLARWIPGVSAGPGGIRYEAGF